MSEEQGAQQGQQAQRQFLVQRIYTKDISFEAPTTPQIFQENWSPEINVGLGSEVKQLGNGNTELVLSVNVEAKHDGKTVFLVEVKQAGLFLVQGFNDEETQALMGIAAPNVLFPYAREVVSDLVTRGSFPQFIAFTENNKVIGKLWLQEPMRFEGDVKKSARVFFDNVIELNNGTLTELKKLLRAARCPDDCCDGEGTCASGRTVPGYDGEGDVDWDIWQCQWCDERRKVLDEAK